MAEFIRVMNDLGHTPELAFLANDCGHNVGTPFGVHGLEYRPRPLKWFSSTPRAHNLEVLICNLAVRPLLADGRYDLAFNSNNTWAFLPAGPRYIHYIYYPFRTGLERTPRYRTVMWKTYAGLVKLLAPASPPPPRSAIVAISDFVRLAIESEHKQTARVIYPPAWDGTRVSCRATLRHVVTVGAFHPDKGQLDQVALASRLPRWQFSIMGSTGDWRYFNRVAKAADRTPNVTVVANPDWQRIQTTYRHASHFVHTARFEHFGVVVVEASAAGCVPIVADAGGLPEIVETAELRFASLEQCAERLDSDAARACSLLSSVQDRLHRFGSEAFRSSMTALLLDQPSNLP